MSGFDATRSQIEAQASDLPVYAKYLAILPIGNLEPKETIFCGAGDSLAAAKFIERLMNFEPRALDPYDFILYPEALRTKKKAFFLSVSGRTKTNIHAAKLARKKGLITTAITANKNSELAKACSDVVELRFTPSDELTPGTNSFTSMLLAVSSLFKLPPKIEAARMISQSRDWAKEYASKNGAYHFVASGSFYGIAMYGSAKIGEFVGSRSTYQLTEEFSHMNLFSLEKDDKVIILRFGKEDEKAKDLDASLITAGVKSILLPTLAEREHVVHRAIWYSILLQYLALEVAKKRGKKRPSFLERESLLNASNRMIYP